MHPFYLTGIDVIALHHLPYRFRTQIPVLIAIDQIEDQPFAHRVAGHMHVLDTQLLEKPLQHSQPTRDYRLAIIGQGGQLDRVDGLELEHAFGQLVEADGADTVIIAPPQ